MSVWTSTIAFLLLLLQAVQTQAQQTIIDNVAQEESPRRLVFRNRDWDLTSAYSDVFKILSHQNGCSSFYGGPRTATTVLNGFVTSVKAQPLPPEVSFQMAGRPRLIRDPAARLSYRLFEQAMVNSNGSFYLRRVDAMGRFPSDVGKFAPGSRAARVLILLHELGHLIQDDNGEWLLPDDGSDGVRSKANTMRIQQVCRKELDNLK